MPTDHTESARTDAADPAGLPQFTLEEVFGDDTPAPAALQDELRRILLDSAPEGRSCRQIRAAIHLLVYARRGSLLALPRVQQAITVDTHGATEEARVNFDLISRLAADLRNAFSWPCADVDQPNDGYGIAFLLRTVVALSEGYLLADDLDQLTSAFTEAS